MRACVCVCEVDPSFCTVSYNASSICIRNNSTELVKKMTL